MKAQFHKYARKIRSLDIEINKVAKDAYKGVSVHGLWTSELYCVIYKKKSHHKFIVPSYRQTYATYHAKQ